jgi:hypothetical protein
MGTQPDQPGQAPQPLQPPPEIVPIAPDVDVPSPEPDAPPAPAPATPTD